MDIEELFETYMHSPRLLEELKTDFNFHTVESLYEWLKSYPEGSNIVLMDYFETYEELLEDCEAYINAQA